MSYHETAVPLNQELGFTVMAEQNGTLVGGRYNFSFGNGNEWDGAGINDWGYVVPVDYRIIGWSIGMRLTNTADTVVDLVVNGVSQGLNLTVPGSTTKNFQQALIYTGVAGDTINFQTIAPGGGNDVVVVLHCVGNYVY